jgi:hypothetical protein
MVSVMAPTHKLGADKKYHAPSRSLVTPVYIWCHLATGGPGTLAAERYWRITGHLWSVLRGASLSTWQPS